MKWRRTSYWLTAAAVTVLSLGLLFLGRTHPSAAPPPYRQVNFGKQSFNLFLAQPADRSVVQLTLAADGESHSISIPPPSSQALESLGTEITAVDLGEGAPPTVDFSLNGGGDGMSLTFHFLLSLVENKIRVTYRYESEMDSYFNVASCAYLSEGYLWEEKGPEAGKSPGPGLHPISLLRSRLKWDGAALAFKKVETTAQPAWLASVQPSVVYSKAEAHSKTRDVAAHAHLEVLSYQLCRPKDAEPDCDPGLPAEMPRWYEVMLADRSKGWFLLTEDTPYETNLHCSL